MSDAINLTTNTDVTAESLGVKHGVSKIRLLAKGGAGIFFIKHNDAQGYASAGETLPDGEAKEFYADPQDIFKVTFSSGTVTAKKIG